MGYRGGEGGGKGGNSHAVGKGSNREMVPTASGFLVRRLVGVALHTVCGEEGVTDDGGTERQIDGG